MAPAQNIGDGKSADFGCPSRSTGIAADANLPSIGIVFATAALTTPGMARALLTEPAILVTRCDPKLKPGNEIVRALPRPLSTDNLSERASIGIRTTGSASVGLMGVTTIEGVTPDSRTRCLF